MKNVFSAARFFLGDQDIDRIEPFGTGNVNDTYLVTLPGGKQHVLQRINPTVFPDLYQVQHNLRIVTRHLNQAILNSPELKDRFIPITLFSGDQGDTYLDGQGALWRLVNRISGETFETISTPSQAEELGGSLGLFHQLLSTLEPTILTDTLPGFHDTSAYLKQYDKAWQRYRSKDEPDVQFCHSCIEPRRSLAALLDDSQGLSSRVIHGDPKVANFVVDVATGRVVSLIDLDTVKPGLLLHDIGDALRSSCNPLGESPPGPEQIYFDPDLFAAWLKGYTRATEFMLTNDDKAHIVQSARVITFELGLRFITDYLEGNHYFKIRYPEHNLFRAKVQFHLVQSIEKQLDNLETIVKTIC